MKILENGYDPENTHDIWDESEDIDEKTLKDFTEKFISNSEKGTIPTSYRRNDRSH